MMSGGALVPRGTGGAATIINNAPILNSVAWGAQNYQRDQLLKAQLAAKQRKEQTEASEFKIPELESANGGAFTDWARQRQDERIKQGLAVFSDPNARKEDKDMESRLMSRDLKNYNHYATTQDAILKAKVADLTARGYNVGPLTQEVIKKNLANPNLDKADLSTELETMASSRPDLLNIDKIGDELMSGMKENGVKIRQKDGTEVNKTWSQIFKQPKRLGEPPQLDFEVTKTAVDRIPDARNWVDRTKESVIKEMLADPVLRSGKTPEQLDNEAEAVALTKLFKGRGIVNWDIDKETTKTKARSQEAGRKAADIMVGMPTNVDRVVKTTRGNEVVRFPNAVPIKIGKKQGTLPAGAEVYAMGDYTDPNGLTVSKMFDTQALRLKDNLTAEDFVYVPQMPIATEDFILSGKPVKKGEVIYEAVSNPDLLKSVQGSFKYRDGYVASPNQLEIEEEVIGFDPNTQTDITTIKRRNPASTSLLGEIFIPRESLPNVELVSGFKPDKKKPFKLRSLY